MSIRSNNRYINNVQGTQFSEISDEDDDKVNAMNRKDNKSLKQIINGTASGGGSFSQRQQNLSVKKSTMSIVNTSHMKESKQTLETNQVDISVSQYNSNATS